MIQGDVDHTVNFLNQLLDVDKVWMQSLFSSQFRCNQSLSRHPTVQTTSGSIPSMTYASVLGLINGLHGVFDEGPYKDHGPIQAVFEGFALVRFERVVNE